MQLWRIRAGRGGKSVGEAIRTRGRARLGRVEFPTNALPPAIEVFLLRGTRETKGDTTIAAADIGPVPAAEPAAPHAPSAPTAEELPSPTLDTPSLAPADATGAHGADSGSGEEAKASGAGDPDERTGEVSDASSSATTALPAAVVDGEAVAYPGPIRMSGWSRRAAKAIERGKRNERKWFEHWAQRGRKLLSVKMKHSCVPELGALEQIELRYSGAEHAANKSLLELGLRIDKADTEISVLIDGLHEGTHVFTTELPAPFIAPARGLTC